MMTFPRLLIVGALAIATLHTGANAQQGAAALEGSWTGRTSQGRPIGFRIESGIMRTLDLDWTMHLDQVCPGRTGSAPAASEIEHANIVYFYPKVPGYEPPQIRFPSFALSRELETPAMPVTLMINGQFSSESSVTGDLTLTVDGCPGQETVTWKAGKKAAR